MKSYLTKPNLYFFDEYNNIMREWLESQTQIAPWFLGKPFENLDDFEQFIQISY